MLICFDIDGTLADLSHRLHYLRESPKNWAMFKSEVVNDTPIEPICILARTMAHIGHKVILCSGRSEETREATEQWLWDNDIGCHKLYMRAEKDYRSDDIVKNLLLAQIILDWGQKPNIWFDDRPRVVKMLRECGVFVADVYQGTEDF